MSASSNPRLSIEVLELDHLVRPLYDLSLEECERRLREAHTFLAARAMEAAHSAAESDGTQGWGRRFKRANVDLRQGPPTGIGRKDKEALVEVINQCATIERLLDALAWARGPASSLADFRVKCCHPTTSSDPTADETNDLVLEGPGDRRARFEVSDVASEEDRNDKERKDLRSLGVLHPDPERKGKARLEIDGWPDARLFLVVAPEFARRLRRRRRADHLAGDPPHCHYVEVPTEAETCIFEVLRGGAVVVEVPGERQLSRRGTAPRHDGVLCLCGCGGAPRGRSSVFMPGHDARVKGRVLGHLRGTGPAVTAEQLGYAQQFWGMGMTPP